MIREPPVFAQIKIVHHSGQAVVAEQRLHQLIRQNDRGTYCTFKIRFLDACVEVFAFTFD